ncbi:MAG: hypothetical protein LBM00_01445 [Deltaproteobacteria bacterium]|jgi:hypothetical protein|nr:hypothetical protein [Deltaproteobacteria bacterium]
MSGNFRVNDSAPGNGPEGRTSSRKKESGLTRFKRGRVRGEIVSGVFVSLEPAAPGTAWVNFEGDKLLAVLPEEWAKQARRIVSGKGLGAASAEAGEKDFPLRPGSQCYFALEALEPEPVLRMLGLDPLADAREGKDGLFGAFLSGARAMPPVQLISRYAGFCADMDGLLRRRLWPARNSLYRAAYLDFIQNEKEARGIYARLTLCRAAVVLALKPRGLRDLLFLPWLNPQASGVNMAILAADASVDPAAGRKFILQALYPSGMRMEIRGKLGAKPEKEPKQDFVAQLRRAADGNDLFSALLALYPGDLRGGFSLRA